jgi:hypothetical protein
MAILLDHVDQLPLALLVPSVDVAFSMSRVQPQIRELVHSSVLELIQLPINLGEDQLLLVFWVGEDLC